MKMLLVNGRILRAVLLVLVIGLTALACVYVPPARRHVVYVDDDHRGSSRHVYHYYPSANVYFDPGTRYYYWLEGTNWRKGRTLPRDVVVTRQRRIEFETDAREPYTVHERVRRIDGNGTQVIERREYRTRDGDRYRDVDDRDQSIRYRDIDDGDTSTQYRYENYREERRQRYDDD